MYICNVLNLLNKDNNDTISFGKYMRLRNVKGSREKIAATDYVIHDEETMKGRWHEVFGNDNPIHIEIGMGKGQFIMELARRNPDINYIGIEKYSSVLLRALEKRELEEDIHNLYFIRMDAEYIEKVFDTNEVSRIYLNFSDPWPKDRHAKRRLTSTHFFGFYSFRMDRLSLRLTIVICLIFHWNRFPLPAGSYLITPMIFITLSTMKATL